MLGIGALNEPTLGEGVELVAPEAHPIGQGIEKSGESFYSESGTITRSPVT